jgi:type IV secretion system protein VirB4
VFEKIRFRERLFSEYVPIVSHVADSVLRMDDHSTVAMFELDGLPWETAEPETVNLWHERLNNTFRNIAADTVVLYTYQCRGEANPGIYPKGRFRKAFPEALDLTYRERIFAHGLAPNLYLNRLFLAVQVRSPRYAGEFIGERLDRRRAGKEMPEEAIEDRVARLESICGLIAADLKAYGPRRLGVAQRGRALFSEIAEALAYALTGHWRPIGLNTGRLGNSLLCERIIFGPEAIEIRAPGRSHFAAMFGAREYPSSTWPGMFGALSRSPYRSTVAQVFRFIGKADAETLMTRKQNRMLSAEDKARSQIAELNDATDHLASNRLVLGDHGLGFCVFASSPRELNAVATAAWRDLADSGIVVAREDRALEAAYAAMIFGNLRYRVRPGAITSRNFCAMAPMHNFPAGEARGHWGEPVALFRTTGGTGYRFHLHVKDLGNTFVSGRAGSGKTTWLGFIVCQADRFGAQVVLWDKDRGLEILCRAMGGSYLALGVPTGLSLLKGLDNTPENRMFQAQIIRGAVGGTMTAEEDRRLNIGLRSVMAQPPEDRWLREVRAFLGVDAKGAGARLDKWCFGNEFGGVFDCAEDTLRLDASVIGFDQTKILDNPMARGPVMAILFHRVESLIDGRKLLFIVDEFWKSLQDEQFTAVVRDKLATLRKRNSPVILATQSPRSALDSSISYTIKEQSPTQVYFSNGKAEWRDYGEEGMGLTRPEFEIVKTLPEGSGLFLLRQGAHSVVAQLPMGGMDDEIAVLSGREETVRVLDRARAEVGDDPAELLPAFHRMRKETT